MAYRIPLNKFTLLLSCSSEIILQANDVVFAQVTTTLNFDKYQCVGAGILNPMGCVNCNIDRLAGGNDDFAVVQCHLCRTLHNHPVLGSLRMLLITQSFTRQYFNSLHFEVVTFVKHRKTPPGSPIESWRVVRTIVKHAEGLPAVSVFDYLLI